jgi:putative aldouronate transport system substrate-binding protein
LIGYVPGDPSPENDVMMEELNAKLKNDINATIEFKYLNWGEFFDKYPLILLSGEVYDFAYIASWAEFHSHAAKGAYLDITDLLDTYAPEIRRIADPAVWNATSYKGRIYGIPHDGQELSTSDGFVYREDLRKKYNVPEIEKIEDFEAYMQAIKENEPGMETNTKDAVNNNMMLRYAEFQRYGWDFDWYGLVYDMEDPTAQLFSKYETDEYKDLIELMAEWREMGFWDTSVISDKEFTNEVQDHPWSQGLNAFFGKGTGHYNMAYEYVEENNLDWEIEYFWPKSPSGYIRKGDVLNDGVSVSPTSPNPERTLMAIDTLLTQKEYQFLMGWGVEERHYVIGEDGFPKLPDGIDADNAPYKYYLHPFSWFFYNTKNTLPQRDEDRPVDILNKEMDAVSKALPLFGFYFDTAELTTEMAALNDIWVEYEIPLQWGFIQESVEADLANLVAKQKAAGIDKVIEEAQRQIDEFIGN